MDAAPSLLTVVSVIVSILLVCGFLHIWAMVSQIRSSLAGGAKLAALTFTLEHGKDIVGLTGAAESWMTPEYPKSKVEILGVVLDCEADVRVESGAIVKVIGMRGQALRVEPVKPVENLAV
ncbi:MAG: hypothetical protein ACRDF4_02945 [Rhabdochlamydiaceae bacterium]